MTRTQTLLAMLAVAFNALAWGVAWWPFRELDKMGLHALWATALIYSLALVVLTVLKPGAWRVFRAHPALLGLCAASGLTNLGFNWGIAIGDVVRVVLCFYLMPLWSLLLAWLWLGERPTRVAWAQVALALCGMLLVMVPQLLGGSDGKSHTQPLGLADALGVLGGLSFAFTNLYLRKLRDVPSEGRSASMFLGGAAFSGVVAWVLGMNMGTGPNPIVPALPAVQMGWALLLLALAGFYLSANLSLQYGAARLAPRITALVLLSEVVFASVSSWLLGASSLTWNVLAGGALVLLAAALAGLMEKS
jgi:drug/metabolite transporter (DMT)-like permease